jgi:SPP1 gp7 family putative phage head morphogenesis protein
MKARAKDKVLPSVNPNAGLQQLYKRRLLCLIDAMHRSYAKWVCAAYRANEPRVVAMAADALPADELKKVLDELSRHWLRRFDEGAQALAEYFAKAASQRTDAQLRAILKKAGFAVDFKMTAAQRDIVKAIVAENVSLIRSIPDQYMKGVEGSVMRSVQIGRDVGGLAKELQEHYGVTKRRASLISRDQNNKATAAMNRSRQLEVGIEKARWKHSHGGKTPRPTHVAADGEVYEVAKGWYDPAVKKYIQPGELISCRCTSQSIIPGFI